MKGNDTWKESAERMERGLAFLFKTMSTGSCILYFTNKRGRLVKGKGINLRVAGLGMYGFNEL